MTEFIIWLRETLEAVLIIWIISSIVVKQWNKELLTTIRKAIATALFASFVIARWFWYIDIWIDSSPYQTLLEALLLFITAGILMTMVYQLTKWSYRVFFLQQQSSDTLHPDCASCELSQNHAALRGSHKRSIKETIKNLTQQALWSSTDIQKSIFGLVFFALIREGFETVLLIQASMTMQDSFNYTSFSIGIFVALCLWYMLFVVGKRINLRTLFTASSVLLVIFASGMIAYGIHETEEFLVDSGYIQESNISRVWNIYTPQKELSNASNIWRSRDESKSSYTHILHDKWTIWSIAKWLIWYNSNPNRIEFLVRCLMMSMGIYIIFGDELKKKIGI